MQQQQHRGCIGSTIDPYIILTTGVALKYIILLKRIGLCSLTGVNVSHLRDDSAEASAL